MPINFTEEYEKELIEIIESTDNDLKNMPKEISKIRTTADFFAFRDFVKSENGYDKYLRNKIVEDLIKGNESLELLYAWSKFYRVIDKSRAIVYNAQDKFEREHISFNKEIASSFNPVTLSYSFFTKTNFNKKRLFDIIKIQSVERPIGLRKGFRNFGSEYEFLKYMLLDEENEPWPIDILLILLKAYGIDKSQLKAFTEIIEEECLKVTSDIISSVKTEKEYILKNS